MTKSKRPDSKVEALKQRGTLNPHPEKVKDSLFADSDFFDPRDLVQVKYEMVRRVHVDREPVSHSAATFGFSRPSFYQAQKALARDGLAGLEPKKPGPRRSHKLGAQVVDFMLHELEADSSLRAKELARRVEERFGIEVHPRSIERALARQKKKRA